MSQTSANDCSRLRRQLSSLTSPRESKALLPIDAVRLRRTRCARYLYSLLCTVRALPLASTMRDVSSTCMLRYISAPKTKTKLRWVLLSSSFDTLQRRAYVRNPCDTRSFSDAWTYGCDDNSGPGALRRVHEAHSRSTCRSPKFTGRVVTQTYWSTTKCLL